LQMRLSAVLIKDCEVSGAETCATLDTIRC
jgi:hypothetical protein